MDRQKVDSSSIHSIGHDPTGLEVQFHEKGCAAATWKPNPASQKMKPGTCSCEGGEVYFYPGVSPDLHEYLTLAPSLGAAFAAKVKGAKHPETGKLLYPHVKREAAKS